MTLTALPLAFFINPWLLGLGAAMVAVPIIIHLLNRRRVRRVEWAAMEWLLAALKRHQRRLRLENWLILALRCLAILLLGLALARPVVTDSAIGLFGEKRSVYVVLDTSYSTAAKTDVRSVFERVKHEAELVLGGLSKQDSLAIIVTNHPDEDNYDGVLPSVLVTRTLGLEGIARAKEAVAALQPRHAPARWSDTLALLQEQIQVEDTNRQVIVITDLQAKDWLKPQRTTVDGEAASETGGDRLTENLIAVLRQRSRVQVLDVGGTERRNLAITSVLNHSERGAFVGRPLRLEVQVANYGTSGVTGAVLEVSVGGRPVRKLALPVLEPTVAGPLVPKSKIESIRVDLPRTTFEKPGSHEVRVRVGPPNADPTADGLGLDSERWFAVSVRRQIQVLAYTKDSEPPANARGFRLKAKHFLEGIYEGDRPGDGTDVLGLGSLYAFEHVDLAQSVTSRLRDRRYAPVDLVVLANAPIRDPSLVDALRTFVSEGGALMVWSGDQFKVPGPFNEAYFGDVPEERLAPFALAASEIRRPAASETPFAFDLAEQARAHPLARMFTGPDAEEWLRQQPPQIWGRTAFVETPRGPDPGSEGPDALPEPAGQVVLRFEDGKPAVVASEFGEGRTLWIGTSLDTGWMRRAAAPFLPVFLEEAALWLTEPKDEGRNLLVGDRIELQLPAGAEEPRFSVPGGMQMAPTRRVDAPSGSGRSTITYDTVGVSGIWKLSYRLAQPTGESDRVVEMIAVNPDPEEGSLIPASTDAIRAGVPPELELSFHTGFGETSEEIREVREGEMTRYLIWALIAILLLESFLAMRFGRRAGTEGSDA